MIAYILFFCNIKQEQYELKGQSALLTETDKHFSIIDSLNEKTPPKIGGVTIGDAKLASYELKYNYYKPCGKLFIIFSKFSFTIIERLPRLIRLVIWI